MIRVVLVCLLHSCVSRIPRYRNFSELVRVCVPKEILPTNRRMTKHLCVWWYLAPLSVISMKPCLLVVSQLLKV